MVCKLEVPIVAAGGAAFLAEHDLDQTPVHARMIRPEPLHHLGDVEHGLAVAKLRARPAVKAFGKCSAIRLWRKEVSSSQGFLDTRAETSKTRLNRAIPTLPPVDSISSCPMQRHFKTKEE